MRKIIYSARNNKSRPSMIAIGDVIGMLGELTSGRDVVIVTDKNLYSLYPQIIDKYRSIVIETGESNKILATVESIHRELLALGADRETFLVGFGGGIVTDITGFVASTYMRGVDFGFIATSLLAQVDASTGGKNGVNLDGYKNIIGTFNQPDFVLCDLQLIKTLPPRELKAAMSEAIKCGIIGDSELFDIFLKNTFAQIVQSDDLIFEIVCRSIQLKVSIVNEDEHEQGTRKLLNLGHTFAHAIEKCTDEFNHGEAVAIGLAIIGGLSCEMGILSAIDYQSIITALNNQSLPVTIDSVPLTKLSEVAAYDKKRSANSISLIIIESIGECRIEPITVAELNSLVANSRLNTQDYKAISDEHARL